MDPESAQVREFIERLVESLVSGGLDDVCIKRIHSHPDYKPMPEQESPSSAHSALKQLIQNIIREAMTLPTLQGLNQAFGPESGVPTEDMTSKTYEDILATAILNKVIQQYQKCGGFDGNRNVLDSTMEQQPTFISRIEIGVKGPESLESEKLHGSLNNSDITDPMSLTIEECIEEVTTVSNPEEDDKSPGEGELNYLPGLDFVQRHRVPFPELGMDIVEGAGMSDLSDPDEEDEDSPLPTDLINPMESWEENWLFQRRRLKNGAVPQSMPVPMLVPNPSEDYRALIGDRDAEEISDLSDCSDEALENLVLAEESDPLPPRNAEERFSAVRIVIHETEPTREYNSSSDERDELLEAKNMELVKSTSVDCLSEFGQQDSEYTEDYTSATRRQLDSLSGVSDHEITPTTAAPATSLQHLDTNPEQLGTEEVEPRETQVNLDLAVPPRPGTDQSDDEYCTLPSTGTIAEREHKKWESAPPLPNNPYSPENISKRLNKRDHFNSRSSSSEASVEFPEFKNEPVNATVIEKPLQIVCAPADLDQKRYGRDYYINSKAPSSDMSRLPSNTHQSPASQEISKPSPVNNEQNHEPVQEDIKMTSESKTQSPSLVESEVARLQKEINQSEQRFKSLMVGKSDAKTENTKQNKNSDSKKDLHKFTKVIITSTLPEEEQETQPTRDFSKRQQIPQEELKQETIYGKTSFKQIKFPVCQEQRKSPEIQIESRKQLMDEHYLDVCLNGSGRSESPSGSSIISTDSELNNLPSVKELTKRFSTIVDSDSSTSTPKCPSPAPRWKSPEQPPVPAERTILSNLSASRPVREVHSLTARSISREFREELRQNQQLPLDRNIYNQSGSCLSLSNGESSSIPSSTSEDGETPSPIPEEVPRTVSTNIAFWEQLQQDKL